SLHDALPISVGSSGERPIGSSTTASGANSASQPSRSPASTASIEASEASRAGCGSKSSGSSGTVPSCPLLTPRVTPPRQSRTAREGPWQPVGSSAVSVTATARPTRIRLRPWQSEALDAFTLKQGRDFLAVATPGAGKTTFALTAAVQDLAEHPGRRLVVVAPTQHLKQQWADAALRFGLHLEPQWSARDGALPLDMHGVVTTYQQVATSAAALAPLARDAFVVFDEIHHAGDDRAWGESVLQAFGGAAQRLALSGTPFRSDSSPIPFVRYHLDEALPDYEYGYGEALADGGVVRPVYFPRINGFMEWMAPDGSVVEATFEDELPRELSNQRLRTALSLEGQWL